MAGQHAIINGQGSTLANLKAAGAWMEAIFGSGWVQTADTGQTASSAFVTVTVNTPCGYQIWRMNDTLQATKPVFVKWEIGCGTSGTGYGFQLWLTVGTGSNGTGTITGIIIPRTTYPTIGNGNYNFDFFGSGGTNRACGILGITTYAGGSFPYTSVFSIERTHDATGADTNDGIYFVYSQGNFGGICQYVPFVGTLPSSTQRPVIPVGETTTTLAVGNTIGVLPILPYSQYTGAQNPSLNLLAYYSSDTASTNTIAVNVYGSSHTYATSGMPYGWTSICVAWPLASFMVRYE